ncbi:MAG: glycosyltransferase [Chitinophagaceae bacterium]|nr:glycosyltransferase [Chitinophagaceae bacterium]
MLNNSWLVIILIIYLLALLFILMYSIAQAYLTVSYLKANKKSSKQKPITAPNSQPHVTVQLPIYNERYVAERLIDAVASIDYPKDKLEIQVLDDSTDDTVSIINDRLKYWKEKGLDIKQVRRKNRIGYKAGALREGLKTAKGELIAIFDADFVPGKDFLSEVTPEFTSEHVGMVQTRWGHLNRNHSILTKAQAYTIDAHFRIEQTGRNCTGCFINFNGTAGVWRKQCIIDAGNWQDDTLTEDLDLSYRAQLKGWQFKYLEQTVAPAELPPVMSAVKSQQYRWNKGGAETAKKLWPKLLRAKLPFKVKWQGSFHLLNSAVYIAVIISALCSIPLLHFKQTFPAFKAMYGWLSIFLLSFIIVAWIFFIVGKQYHINTKDLWKNYIKDFPLFLSVSMGLSLHNAIAVIEGYAGRKTPFIRTPKFNNNKEGNSYLQNKLTLIALLELLLVFYFAYGVYYAFQTLDFTMFPFHLMLTVGFAIVSYYSIFHKEYSVSPETTDERTSIA